jgi:hypothetical protein
MSLRPRTKKELLARIWRGPVSVHAVDAGTKYRVAVPEDPDPNGGVWISLSSAYELTVENGGHVYARVEGRDVHLTRAEASRIARFVATCMRRRAIPWRHSSARSRAS